MIKISISPRGMRPPVATAYLGTTPFRIEELMRDGVLPFRDRGVRVISVVDLNEYFDSLFQKKLGSGQGKLEAEIGGVGEELRIQ